MITSIPIGSVMKKKLEEAFVEFKFTSEEEAIDYLTDWMFRGLDQLSKPESERYGFNPGRRITD